MKPLVSPLFELLGVDVMMTNDCIGEEVEKEVFALPEGGVLFPENLRIYNEDQRNDTEFAMMLTSIADLCVNDVFIASYMALASTDGVIEVLKPVVLEFSMQRMIQRKRCEEVLEEWLRCIGHIRVWCKAGGITVNISEFCTGNTKLEVYHTSQRNILHCIEAQRSIFDFCYRSKKIMATDHAQAE